MKLSEKQQHFTRMVGILIGYAHSMNIGLTFGEAWRTKEQQEIYLKSGKSKTVDSKHLERLAVDFNVFIKGEYRTDRASYEALGNHWKSLDSSNKWGGDWGWDANHFEYGG